MASRGVISFGTARARLSMVSKVDGKWTLRRPGGPPTLAYHPPGFHLLASRVAAVVTIKWALPECATQVATTQ